MQKSERAFPGLVQGEAQRLAESQCLETPFLPNGPLGQQEWRGLNPLLKYC